MFAESELTALNLESRIQIEEICFGFEEAWNNLDDKHELADSELPSIDDFMNRAPTGLVGHLFLELVLIAKERRDEIGRPFSKADLMRRFPEHGEKIDRVFQADRSESSSVVDPTLVIDGSNTRPKSVEESTELPKNFGDYQVVRTIGRGGMGIVYEAIQESLNRRVAIKTLTAHPVHVPKLAVRFQQEAKAVARLHHTNIINIFDSGLTDGIPYFAMQLIDGCGLDQKIAEAKSMIEQESGKSKSTYDHILVGKLDRKKIANLAMQIADGLDYAHRKGVLHRDIKPANLLLDKNGSIWIGDFGLAKLADQDTTRTGDLLGTLKYLPPEAIKGEWDERSDVYSLGLTLYELVTLQPAYSETENVKLLARISSGSPPTNPIAIDSTIPHDLETIIMKSIACEPDSRYQTAGELRDDLDRFIKDQPVLARRAHLPERLFKWAKRNPSLAGLIATVTMVAIFGVPLLGYLWFSAAKQRDNALYEKSVAQSARASEKIAKELALDSQRREEVLREDAEAFAYSNAMQLAMINLEKGNLIEAEIVLNQWDPANNGSGTGKTEFVDRRDWEWYFIRKMLDSSIETFVFDHLNVANIAIRPDEKQIAAIVEIEPAKREIVLINLDDHSRTSIGTVDFAATGIGYSPDGSKLVASGYFETQPELWGKVVVWDIEKKSKINDRTFTETETQKYRNGFFGNRYLARCYFEDKKTIVVGPGPFRILDADSLEVKESHEGTAFFRFGKEDITFRVEKAFRTIDGQKEQLNSDRLRRMASFDVSVTDNLSKNPNRQTNLFFSHHNRQGQSFVRILRYHRKSRDEFGTLEDYQDVVCPGVCCGSIAKDGKKFVWATKTGSVYVTTINRESSTYRLNGHMQLVNNVILTENGKHVFTCSVDGTIKKWNVERPNQKLSSLPLRTKNFLADIQFTEDNESILGIAEAPMAKEIETHSNSQSYHI